MTRWDDEERRIPSLTKRRSGTIGERWEEGRETQGDPKKGEPPLLLGNRSAEKGDRVESTFKTSGNTASFGGTVPATSEFLHKGLRGLFDRPDYETRIRRAIDR
ncbi:hypothetical protein BSZ35_02255 [Salinibacter sp. 10B]|nr:hypothetical protein BSZ35_02255 [Salinibacter sp. 10B]